MIIQQNMNEKEIKPAILFLRRLRGRLREHQGNPTTWERGWPIGTGISPTQVRAEVKNHIMIRMGIDQVRFWVPPSGLDMTR